jgi:DNA processing protein
MDSINREILKAYLSPGFSVKTIISMLREMEEIGKPFSVNSLFKKELEEDLAKEIAYIKKEGIKTLGVFDEDYPESLRRIFVPSPLLFYKGSIKLNRGNAIAIVGSRRCSEYGIRMAERLAFDLAKRGVTIVSGMAKGVDTAAHRGALKAGGKTIAVMGSGFGHIYPTDAGGLVAEIIKSGAVVTEFHSGMEPFPSNFPQRNRIVSGLSLGVIVVEAAKRSGALITANIALEEGKEVFALPGRVDSVCSAGTNKLIQDGAKLIMSADDVLDEIAIDPLCELLEEEYDETAAYTDLPDDEVSIIRMLEENEAVHYDKLLIDSGIGLSRLPELLLKMEMRKTINALPGSYFSLCRDKKKKKL